MNQFLNCFKFTIIACIVTACTHPIYKDAAREVHDTQQQIKQAERFHMRMPGSGGKLGTYKLAQLKMRKPLPKWTKRRVNIRIRDMAFAFINDKLFTNTAAQVAYKGGVDSTKNYTFQYQGSIKGALDALAHITGFAYTIDANNVSWSDFETQSYDVSFLPGASNYLVGKVAGAISSNHGTDMIDVHSDTHQFSNLSAHVSIWHDVEQTLMQLKSKDGQISVSQASTTVTVHDHPDNVIAIKKYLQQLNLTMSREVAFQVQVLEVDMNKGFNYGVDWDIVRHVMDLAIGLEGRIGRPVALESLGRNTADSGAGFILRSEKGLWQGTKLLINALNQQGRVSTVTRPQLVTLNNNVAEIDINTQTGYLKEVSTTTTGVTPTVANTLTPGMVKTGFTLYLLPKIQKQDVFLQISSTLSNLLGFRTVASQDNSDQIQLPTVTEKRFNQRAVVPSGATLILAGIKQVRNEANETKLYRMAALGSRGAQRKNSETIVLITPTILG